MYSLIYRLIQSDDYDDDDDDDRYEINWIHFAVSRFIIAESSQESSRERIWLLLQLLRKKERKKER